MTGFLLCYGVGMVILRKVGAVLLLVIGILMGVYGILTIVQSLRTAIHGNHAYGLGGLLGGLIVASIGYSLGAFGVRVWRQ